MNARLKTLIAALIALTLVAVAAAQSGVDISQAREIFSEIDSIMQGLHDITGFRVKHRVPAEIITRDKVKEFIEKRMKEASSPEEIRVEELTLKKFGLAPPDFNLAKNTVDLLTEQAAAFYDFHRKRMFITDWTPSATREPALVHELAHALADQNVNLEKFIKQGQKSDDGSLARLAVMEGQASWLMAEYLARKAGQSLANSPAMLETMAHTIESGAGEFPVFRASRCISASRWSSLTARACCFRTRYTCACNNGRSKKCSSIRPYPRNRSCIRIRISPACSRPSRLCRRVPRRTDISASPRAPWANWITRF